MVARIIYRNSTESLELAETRQQRVPDLLAHVLPVPAVAHDVRLARLALNQSLLRLLRAKIGLSVEIWAVREIESSRTAVRRRRRQR